LVPKFIKSNNQAILPAIQSNPLSRAQSVNHPQQSTSTAVVPQQKTSTGAKPNTIVRIFVDGKPVALTTEQQLDHLETEVT
jgi:predicted secreted protein